jgi:hypothetical protein
VHYSKTFVFSLITLIHLPGSFVGRKLIVCNIETIAVLYILNMKLKHKSQYYGIGKLSSHTVKFFSCIDFADLFTSVYVKYT